MMRTLMWNRHHVLLGVLLLGNTVAFAGVDPVTRLATAVLVLVMVVDPRTPPPIPALYRWAVWILAGLVVVQLVPLPAAARGLLQPGYAHLLASGWAPISLAPWATAQVAASVVMMFGIALVAARMTVTRTGLPVLLALLATTGVVLSLLGLAGESGAPDLVLLTRPNSGGGSPYGPFVNTNHFALAIELTVPASVVLLAGAARRAAEGGLGRQRSVVVGLSAGVACAVGVAALIRSESRGGMLFLAVAAIITLPLWRRFRRKWSWRWVAVLGVILVVVLSLVSAQLAVVRDGFSDLLIVEGIEGNTRWDLWRGTVQSWQRSPLLGSGLGSYRYVIGVDKPATGNQVLEQAHNDWLEWLATGGLVGAAALLLLVAGVVRQLEPRGVRQLRREFRYALAGASLAMVAAALHEAIGFGLQTPLNRYLLAAWIGLAWGADRFRPRQDFEEHV
jgi:hypothetical protein